MIDLLRGRKGSNKFVIKTPLQYSGVRFEHGENSHCAIITNRGMDDSRMWWTNYRVNKGFRFIATKANNLTSKQY